MKWKNLDLVILIPATFLLAIFNIPYVGRVLHTDLAPYASATILFALGSITLSLLQDRKARLRLLERVDVSELGLLRDDLPPNVAAEFRKSERVMLIGVSALSYVTDYAHVIREMLDRNDEVDVLISDPECEFVAIAAMRDQKPASAYERERIRESDKLVTAWQKFGRARLKHTKAPIDGDYVILYSSSVDISKIYYKHYGYRTRYDASLWMHIDSDVPECFAYFKKHIENLWDDAS